MFMSLLTMLRFIPYLKILYLYISSEYHSAKSKSINSIENLSLVYNYRLHRFYFNVWRRIGSSFVYRLWRRGDRRRASAESEALKNHRVRVFSAV